MDVKGYKINILGDSITEGSGLTDMNDRYDNLLVDMLGIAKINNYSISGTRLAHQSRPSIRPRYDLCFCGRAYDMDHTADMVIVYGGVNDYFHGDAPFGEMGDTIADTYCGAVYFLMNYLRETYGEKPIIFLTPARCFLRGEIDDRIPSTHATRRIPGKPLVDYADVIIETAKLFNIHVLDLYRELGINPLDPKDFEKYTVDGLHFNAEGHKILANKVIDFIKAI